MRRMGGGPGEPLFGFLSSAPLQTQLYGQSRFITVKDWNIARLLEN